MARADPAGADPDIPSKEAPSRAPEEPTEAAQRLQRVRANLRLPDRPFAALSPDHDAGLRDLRLLEFVRLDLPSSGVPRPDLVAELIANYSGTRGWSSVRGKQIEVSLESLAKALRLPPYASPASSDTDRAARASASIEFARVYIGAPAEASTGMKRRLPSTFFDKNVKRGPDYTTELIWELLKQEMEHLIESESTDCVSYYGAFLQRLIWVERPELFQPPPELLSEAVALCVRKEQESNLAALCVRKEQESNLAALCVWKEQESNLAALCFWKEQESNLPTIHENQECCSESDIHRAEAGPKQVDVAAKTTWSGAFDSDKGYLLTESHQDNSVPRKTASVSRRSVSRALSFKEPDVADEVQELPPVVAATPSPVLHKKGRGRPCKAQTALVEPGNRSPWKVQTAPVEPENCIPCKVQTALVEPENRSPRKVQTALVEPENRRVTRGSIKSNGFKPTPVVDQQARPKKKLGAKMMLKKQTPARPQGTMIKQMKRRK
ncbi:hypothetical protein ACQ4PT_068016 [Festuca glaucescens]